MVGHLLRSISKGKGELDELGPPLGPLPSVIYLSHHPVFLKYLEPTGRNSLSESESPVWLFATPWTIQFVQFSRPEYYSG